ncbi:hypothetical protein Taro_017145 [Colocasia esculenta]|uniref:Uncharacterized protein n=1 Tax=Colocasia esculenta TaxID=4460 RepID=A0A843UMD2_COLES|nr:hypothetical protein [Colocasia esculenta]
MLKDHPGRAQNVPRRQGRLNAVIEANLPEERGMGRVEELLVAEEQWNDHKKLIFFPFSSSATCTNRPLEVDQRRGPCERDGPIGRVLGLVAIANPVAF